MSEPDTLECDHCGCVAIESETGLFDADASGPCISCGMPGHVSIDDSGDEEDHAAEWLSSDERGDRCTRADCEECNAE